MPAPLVPIVIAGVNIVRMVAPTVARALTRSGLAKKASKKAVEKAGDKIPRATQSQVEKLSRQGTERKNLQNLNRAQKLDKQSKGESAIQTLRRAEKQEKAASGARTNLTPRQEAARLRQLNQRQKKQEEQAKKPKRPTPPSKPTSPSKPTPPSKPRISDAGKGVAALTATATGVGGLASLNKKDKKKRKVVGSGQTPATGYVKPKRKPNVDLADDTYIKDSKPTKAKKSKKTDDEYYKFYGKEGTPLGDFSRKYKIKYATEKGFERDFPQDEGAKKGGSLKKLAKKKRKGFSGRGAGKALRGF